MIDEIHRELDRHVEQMKYSTILDVGGWFIPYPRATHVVDLLPWETRGGKLQLHPDPEEHFSKNSWFTIDICDPAVPFPFPDKSFDFVVCSGTLEDLPDPLHCIRELERVGRAGYIRVPSMACELTVGVEDRANNVIGYHHHFWICRNSTCGQLAMLSKADAELRTQPRGCIPLNTFERMLASVPPATDRNIHLFWTNTFSVQFLAGSDVVEAVQGYIDSLEIPAMDYFQDSLLRRARRTRDWLKSKRALKARKDAWWRDILNMSKPYLKPELYHRAGGR